MQAKATIFILMISQIADHLSLVMRTENCVNAARHVEGDDQAWHQKHWPSIVTRPVTVVLLQGLVEQQSCTGGLFALFSSRLLALGNFRRRHDAPSFVR